MDEAQERSHRSHSRAEQNEEFLRRFLERNPEVRGKYEQRLIAAEAPTPAGCWRLCLGR
jgi:hypothetical protein